MFATIRLRGPMRMVTAAKMPVFLKVARLYILQARQH